MIIGGFLFFVCHTRVLWPFFLKKNFAFFLFRVLTPIPNDDLKKKDALIKRAILEELNTTENPLWIEQKLKLYEEQELTMQVFIDPDNGDALRRNSGGDLPQVNSSRYLVALARDNRLRK